MSLRRLTAPLRRVAEKFPNARRKRDLLLAIYRGQKHQQNIDKAARRVARRRRWVNLAEVLEEKYWAQKDRLARLKSRLYQLGGVSVGNKVEPMFDGIQAWEKMWEAISQAKGYVWISTFILEDDAIGRRTIKELSDAAKRGVRVVLIYDYVGSFWVGTFKTHVFDELKANGGVVLDWGNLFKSALSRPPWEWSRINPFFRAHQKILVVDGIVGFCGGMNISSDYASPDIGGTGRFRDTHARVEGPAVTHLERVFRNSVRLITDGKAEFKAIVRKPRIKPRFSLRSFYERLTKPGESHPMAGVVHVLSSGGNISKIKDIQLEFPIVVSRANTSINITTPYFAPTPRVIESLSNAAKRGVAVHILTAGKCDNIMASWAAKYAYTKVLPQENIFIHELQNQHLHAKTTVIDDHYASIGSNNLDPLSWAYNTETKIVAYDKEIAARLNAQFEKDKKKAELITEEHWAKRNWIGKAISRFSYFMLSIVYPTRET